MNPGARRLALTAHVTASVGWLGAVGAFLALAIVGLTSRDPSIVRSSYLAMDVTGWYVIVPLSLASLGTGVLQSLGTEWGLFRHYWVLVKLLLTLVAAGVLLAEVGSVEYLASLATTSPDPRQLSSTLPHSIGGSIILTTALILSVVKPRGLTRYGWRKQHQARTPVEPVAP